MGGDRGRCWRGGRHAAPPSAKTDPGPAGAPPSKPAPATPTPDKRIPARPAPARSTPAKPASARSAPAKPAPARSAPAKPAPVQERGRGRRGGRARTSAAWERQAGPLATETARGPARGGPFRGQHRGGHHAGRGEERRVRSFDLRPLKVVSGQSHARDRVSNPLREIGWKKLRELSADNGLTVLEKMSDDSTLVLFEKLTCEKDMPEDWLRLVVSILAKVSTVEYKPIVVKLFSKVCKKQFVDQLLLHISHLPYDNNFNRKEAVGNFFSELSILCKAILELTPSLACENLDIVLKRALQELEEMPSFQGCDTVKVNLKLLREKLMIEKEKFECMIASSIPVKNFYLKPPTESNFRDLSHVPTIEDIVVESFAKPFLRPNKVNLGPYESVDDYLDVHFRLMREDFLRPLREGILDYRKALKERKKTNGKIGTRIQNIRVYEKVHLVHVDTENLSVGLVLNFDPDRKFASKIQWKFSKRFMTGSLLVLSEDEDFSSIVLATVSKRDVENLLNGKVLVELYGEAVSRDLLRRQFMMVECQVFFGAYSHVLKALKDFNENSFPMKTYIVYGSNTPELPDYQIRALDANMKMKLFPKSRGKSTPPGEGVPVDVENLSTWPSSSELGLDESQYRALSGALTNKLMLIQGPPGTGKTFVGLKIAACLIKNQELWRPRDDHRPMLVVCYTNHALDQFLAGLMSVTRSIVRVGGGCKDEALEQFSIKSLRRNGGCCAPRRLIENINNEKTKFNVIKSLGDRIRYCSSRLQKGVLSLKTLWSYGIVSDQYLCLTDEDIFMWLIGCWGNIWENVCFSHYFKESVFIHAGDPAFDHLEFPRAGVTDVTLISFSPLRDALIDQLRARRNSSSDPKEYFEEENFLSMLANLENNLAAPRYRRHTEHQYQPHPADIWKMSMEHRWHLYRHWRDTLQSILEEDFEPLADEIDMKLGEIAKLLVTWRMVEDQHVMAAHEIVGMTTSFAAAHQENLKQLKPRIVIVEEAAEVFESHVLVSLAGEVEHLIMIGDHQQLRPSPSVHELGVKYHLNVSMFERLINNGVNYVTLSTQHRMRPEVARLICPAIYPDLKNHPTVQRLPAVRGVAKNVFFVDHQHPEEYVQDSQSYQNSHEAEFMSCLVKHLLLQGYDPSQITVLSAYKGQQNFFSKLKEKNSHLKLVRITVVDNFQGEESDIILLSLVRSNASDVVGFLKTENRVCVALSRARRGLFMIGNMANLTAADTVWRKVEVELRCQDSIGPSLPLRCDHHGVVNNVRLPEDFTSSPQGGCLQVCRTLMPCGHDCKQVCHTLDMEHKKTKCLEDCQRPACPKQHACPARCFKDPCPPCQVPKEEKLACGHSAKMPCYVKRTEYKCKVVVKCTLPACGHERDAECHQTARPQQLPCKAPCTVRMPCGHTHRAKCHGGNDPDHEKVKCKQRCGQKSIGCTADPEHQCSRVCHQECEDCTVRVEKTLPCGHVNKVPCNMEVTSFKCQHKSEMTLPCGHVNEVPCDSAAATFECQRNRELVLPCGHVNEVPCISDVATFQCQVKCEKTLPCGHVHKVPCLLDVATLECQVKCEKTLPCGHVHKVPCLLDVATFECQVKCEKTLPCGHVQNLPCHLDVATFKCQRKCERTLPCNHKCSKTCCDPCEPCKVQVPKALPGCGHSQTIDCGASADKFKVCKEPCERSLPCGHPCKLSCGLNCSSGRCRQEVPFPGTPACGHTINVPCNQRNDYTPNSSELLALCRHPCPALLKPCDHQCGGSCGECLQGRLHQPCKSKCERRLLCGHLCKAACPVSCPPCTQPCEQKCSHVACKHRCGEPCARCQEPCQRRCEHGRCPRRCGDQCSFECKEACPRKVEGCGHDCIGLCGDPCICRECQEEDPTEIFFGTEDEEGARFVMLPDCKHILESRSLDDWMGVFQNDVPTEIKQRLCPKCSTLITSCQRYGNVMKRLPKDITSVKAQFNDIVKTRAHLDRIKEILRDIPQFPPEYGAVKRFVSQVYRFRESVVKKMPKEREWGATRVPPLNTSEAKNFEQKVLILQSVGLIVDKVVKSTAISDKGKKEMQQAVEQLCSSVSQRDLLCLSDQEVSDINMELERLQRLVQLLQIENVLLASPPTDTKYEETSQLLRGLLPLSKEQGREVDEKLEALAASSSCPVTRLELSTIVAALKMGAGHWFRCPNGHLYCITECGGAMEEANCPVEGCGARIGGGNHRLRRDNTLAGDIDA